MERILSGCAMNVVVLPLYVCVQCVSGTIFLQRAYAADAIELSVFTVPHRNVHHETIGVCVCDV